MHHSSTSTYITNFIKIKETFSGRTYGLLDRSSPNFIDAEKSSAVLMRASMLRSPICCGMPAHIMKVGSAFTQYRSTQLCIPPWSLNRVPASARGKGGILTSARWQVALRDRIWYVSFPARPAFSRSTGTCPKCRPVHFVASSTYVDDDVGRQKC